MCVKRGVTSTFKTFEEDGRNNEKGKRTYSTSRECLLYPESYLEKSAYVVERQRADMSKFRSYSSKDSMLTSILYDA